MFLPFVILTRITTLLAMPVFVDHTSISEIETSYPAVSLDFLRYISETLRNFFQSEEQPKTDPRGMDFAQFVATDRCSGQAAWSCFNDIDTNNDSFVSPMELAEYDKTSLNRVEGMYDDFLETSFIEADNDDNGYVSYKEGADYGENVLKVLADDNWRQLFQTKDFDGDDQLNKKEFMSLVSSWYRGDYNLKFNDYTMSSTTSSSKSDMTST